MEPPKYLTEPVISRVKCLTLESAPRDIQYNIKPYGVTKLIRVPFSQTPIFLWLILKNLPQGAI